nr:MAG TPA: hypothetical protein [Caudoviricetes sp.]
MIALAMTLLYLLFCVIIGFIFFKAGLFIMKLFLAKFIFMIILGYCFMYILYFA